MASTSSTYTGGLELPAHACNKTEKYVLSMMSHKSMMNYVCDVNVTL